MIEIRADLHIHSNFSDGIYDPIEIVKMAAKNKVQIISITDHDSTGAFVKAREAGEYFNVGVISGVEFTSVHDGRYVHILGYFLSHDDKRVLGLCNSHSNSYSDKIGAKQKKYILSSKDVVEFIHERGGVAIVPHPSEIARKLSNWSAVIRQLNPDGIEVYSEYHDASDCKKFSLFADDNGMVKSFGTDFHGYEVPETKIGGFQHTFDQNRLLRRFIRFVVKNKPACLKNAFFPKNLKKSLSILS